MKNRSNDLSRKGGKKTRTRTSEITVRDAYLKEGSAQVDWPSLCREAGRQGGREAGRRGGREAGRQGGRGPRPGPGPGPEPGPGPGLLFV